MRPRVKRRRNQTDQGITLLELVIAVFVLAMGSLAALRATDQARVAIGGAKDRMLAQLVARNRAEELRLPGAGIALSATEQLAGQSFTITTDTLPTTSGVVEVSISATSRRGVGARIVVYLPGGG
ncbi:MAG: type II secretion system protein [Sulfitobacter sp.]